MTPVARIAPAQFADLPGWDADDHAAALSAFRLSAGRALEKPYRAGSLGLTSESFEPAYRAALELSGATRTEARVFFEKQFRAVLVTPQEVSSGFVTGFYEPVVAASPKRTEQFRYPLLSRPHDLVDIDASNRPAGFDPYFAFGRAVTGDIVPFFDRGEIERGALAGRGLEIAWLESKVDLFFVHVQGAARLRMSDGAERRVTYAAKTGHRFTGPGRILADLGEIPLDDVTMQSIRAWFAANPDRVDEILWQNRSYIFFRDAAVDDPSLGPVAAAKVPLMPGRSLAVDRLLHTFGTPFFVDAPTLDVFGAPGFQRLMIAQDTGSAIVGPARGDIFAGSGDAAGDIAGVIKHPARFFMLVPVGLAEKFA